MDAMVESALQHCLPCQAVTPNPQSAQPLKMSPLPQSEWNELAADFSGPWPNGEYFLVVIDEFSRFPIVERVNSTSARCVIPVLDRIMSLLGVPVVLKTDNGPPWTSTEFAQFANYLGFKHRKITPLWPASNSIVERFMASLRRTLQTARIENRCLQQALNAFLRAYRTTPHPSTNKSPSEILLHRTVKTTLPDFHTAQHNDDNELRYRDESAKSKMKEYADQRRHAKTHNFAIGDTVLVHIPKQNKLSPFYNPQPYQITHIKGTMVTAERQGHTITRNASFFKKFSGEVSAKIQQETETADNDDDDVTIPVQQFPGNPQPVQQPAQPPPQPPQQRRYPFRNNRGLPQRLNDYIV